MEDAKKERWYYSVEAVVIALLCFGPFALPLVFLSPKFNKVWKIATTVIVIALTALLVLYSGKVYTDLMKRMDELKAIYDIK